MALFENILRLLFYQRCLHLIVDVSEINDFANPHLRMNCVVDNSVAVLEIKFLQRRITIKLYAFDVD